MLAAALLALVTSESKKGLQVQMADDATNLGVRHAAINVQMGDFLTLRPTSMDVPLEGSTYHLKASALRGLDAMVSQLSRNGMVVYAILLARSTGDEAIDRLILHPKFDPKSPNRLGAFRTTDQEGLSLLRSFSTTLSKRLPIRGWIVGNEVNSHHAWYSMGRSNGDEISASIEASLRAVYEGVRSQGGSVYLSLDHYWTLRHEAPELSLPGKEVIDRVAEIARRKGDFPWNVAQHPYPENLFEPRFWNDKSAPLSFDAPRVTFKNLEVLTEYLKKREFLYQGRPRRVILSEQGFHRPDGPDGEAVQAAAYAYAWQRVARNPGVDAFILHRHVDHSQEGGLRLGLWTNKPGSITDPDRKTKMWEVMKAAGTTDEDKSFAFALPIVGLKGWNEAAPKSVR